MKSIKKTHGQMFNSVYTLFNNKRMRNSVIVDMVKLFVRIHLFTEEVSSVSGQTNSASFVVNFKRVRKKRLVSRRLVTDDVSTCSHLHV